MRHIVQAETDPGWLQQSVVERGLRTVAERGLGYDVLIRADQLPQAIRMAERRFYHLHDEELTNRCC